MQQQGLNHTNTDGWRINVPANNPADNISTSGTPRSVPVTPQNLPGTQPDYKKMAAGV